MSVVWDKETENKFNQLIEKIPSAMQSFARGKISKKAESLVIDDGRNEIKEKDMVDAFFAETPFGFHGPMKTDMETVGIDYAQYGHSR